MSKIMNRFFCCSAVGALMISHTALAQTFAPAVEDEQDSSRSGGLEEIVVTATRAGETDLQETPIAITAFSSAALEKTNSADLQDVAQFVPGLSIGNRVGSGSNFGAIAIRGMGVDAQESSASVGTYIDDVFYASGRGNIVGLVDVARLEVLRGPQGTLFGRNTIAGAIQYVTKAPSNEFEGYIGGTFGEYGRKDVNGALNIPIGDTLAIRFAGAYDTVDGYVRDEFNGIDRGAVDTKIGRVRLKWQPSDRVTVDLKGEYVESSSNGRASLVSKVNPLSQFVGIANFIAQGTLPPITNALVSSNFNPGDFSSAGFNADDHFNFKSKSVSGVIAYDISDNLTLKSITAKSWFDSTTIIDNDQAPIPIIQVNNFDNLDVFTQELQLNGSVADGRLRFTFGGYYYKDKQEYADVVQVGPVPGDTSGGTSVYQTKSFAAYTQMSFDLTDALNITGGLRYTSEKRKSQIVGANTGFIPGPGGVPLPTSFQPLTFAPTQFKFTDWSPYVGINYKAAQDIMLYTKASKGFRAGGFTASKALPGGGGSFNPETAWTYEAGARMEFLDGRVRINPTVFQTDWKDIQFLNIIVVNQPVVVTANAGDARIRGLELEAQFAITDRLVLSSAFAYLDSKYTRIVENPRAVFFNGFNPAPGAINIPTIIPNLTLASELPRAPKLKFSVGLDYTVPMESGAEIGANVSYSWTDNQRAGAADTSTDIDAYGLMNARLQYTSPNKVWSIAAFANNLLNQFYATGGANFADGFTSLSNYVDPGRPRTLGVEAKFNF